MTKKQKRFCEAKIKLAEEMTKKAKTLDDLSRSLSLVLSDEAYDVDESGNLTYRPKGWA